jgi:hypothetical protein
MGLGEPHPFTILTNDMEQGKGFKIERRFSKSSSIMNKPNPKR